MFFNTSNSLPDMTKMNGNLKERMLYSTVPRIFEQGASALSPISVCVCWGGGGQ